MVRGLLLLLCGEATAKLGLFSACRFIDKSLASQRILAFFVCLKKHRNCDRCTSPCIAVYDSSLDALRYFLGFCRVKHARHGNQGIGLLKSAPKFKIYMVDVGGPIRVSCEYVLCGSYLAAIRVQIPRAGCSTPLQYCFLCYRYRYPR